METKYILGRFSSHKNLIGNWELCDRAIEDSLIIGEETRRNAAVIGL